MGSSLSLYTSTDGFVLCGRWWIPSLTARKRATAETTIDNLSDEDLVQRLEIFDFAANTLVHVPSSMAFLGSGRVWRFTSDSIVKSFFAYQGFEPCTMEIVSTHTSIPVPKILRHVSWRGKVWTFMEYIDGIDLREAWGSLALWKKLWVAWTLRCYVRQLRNVTLARPEVPGPIDWSKTAVKCVGHYFTTIGAGPFNSYSELTAWFTSKYRITVGLENHYQPGRTPDPKPYVFDDSMPLVLTHGDISLTNVRIGRDGTVWLLDWGFSGVYPEWFEYAGMMAYDEAHRPGLTPRLWLRLVPFIAGRHRSKQAFMEKIELALDHFGMEE
ncbi:kinase-like domain-containing protein [Mycena haematopus]|nr:kinase-like domain-containing protein [Mycena haematopus]